MPVLTVVFAIGAALCNALSSVLQRRGAKSIPESKSMRWALVVAVLRRPVWLLGLLTLVFAFIFQAAALRKGELALVQPILLAELPLTLLFARLLFRSSAERRAWLGVVGMCVGLAAVLAAAAPSGGRGSAELLPLVLTALSTAGLDVVLVFAALRLEGSPRAAAFGIAAGAGFALTAALMKAAMLAFDADGFAGLLSAWEFYAMIVMGAASLFLWQNALQAATLVSAQPAITLSDPIIATVIGVLVFGEHIRLGGWVALETLGVLLIAAASIELARSPLVSGKPPATSQQQPDQETQPDLL